MNKVIDLKTLKKLEKKLEKKIEQSLIYSNIIIIRIYCADSIKYGDDTYDRNVYAFDEEANFLWTLQKAPTGESPKPYMNIKTTSKELIVEN